MNFIFRPGSHPQDTSFQNVNPKCEILLVPDILDKKSTLWQKYWLSIKYLNKSGQTIAVPCCLTVAPSADSSASLGEPGQDSPATVRTVRDQVSGFWSGPGDRGSISGRTVSQVTQLFGPQQKVRETPKGCRRRTMHLIAERKQRFQLYEASVVLDTARCWRKAETAFK